MSKNLAEAAVKEAIACIKLAEDISARCPEEGDAATMYGARVELAKTIGYDTVERLAREFNVSRELAHKALGAAFDRIRLVK